ncbi:MULTISPECIES: SDR family oxidoreductase [Saccharibacillus]|uniref:SDR family oxidoreductase n=1 Tax=Saccharibacillus brassicae TaxID=2583377 RepID=A0A4Y6UT87_SACBS|nr:MULTISPECIES: SDR family oxidoreductase [Saccharibacillus]MWJ33463.1 NAD(P)H-binding protein [Saccharibacillus sp. WB 17]QDH19586.1 SDR family oxidoreductase [Saccharibacillus brassicae]
MNVLVIGANGQIGGRLVKLLKQEGKHQVKALVRKPEQAEELKAAGIEPVLGNLEDRVEALAEAMQGCDAIVFAAGSGGSTGLDKTLLIDLDGAVKTMEAAEQAGVKRYVIVSAMQAHNRENWSEEIKPYYAAKHYADRMLESTGLQYTIVRPGGLTNDPGTGRISAAENLEPGSISRDDVAAVIAALLEDPNAYRRGFDLVAGDTPIHEAFGG